MISNNLNFEGEEAICKIQKIIIIIIVNKQVICFPVKALDIFPQYWNFFECSLCRVFFRKRVFPFSKGVGIFVYKSSKPHPLKNQILCHLDSFILLPLTYASGFMSCLSHAHMYSAPAKKNDKLWGRDTLNSLDADHVFVCGETKYFNFVFDRPRGPWVGRRQLSVCSTKNIWIL